MATALYDVVIYFVLYYNVVFFMTHMYQIDGLLFVFDLTMQKQ